MAPYLSLVGLVAAIASVLSYSAARSQKVSAEKAANVASAAMSNAAASEKAVTNLKKELSQRVADISNFESALLERRESVIVGIIRKTNPHAQGLSGLFVPDLSSSMGGFHSMRDVLSELMWRQDVFSETNFHPDVSYKLPIRTEVLPRFYTDLMQAVFCSWLGWEHGWTRTLGASRASVDARSYLITPGALPKGSVTNWGIGGMTNQYLHNPMLAVTHIFAAYIPSGTGVDLTNEDEPASEYVTSADGIRVPRNGFAERHERRMTFTNSTVTLLSG